MVWLCLVEVGEDDVDNDCSLEVLLIFNEARKMKRERDKERKSEQKEKREVK